MALGILLSRTTSRNLRRATARLLSEFGVDPDSVSEPLHRDFFVRYIRELRVASAFLIQTGIIEHTGTALHLGHRVIDLADGTICTTMEHWLEGPSLARIIEAARIEWTGPVRDSRAVPAGDAGWVRTGTDIVMLNEIDASKHLRVSNCVHRFSSSGGQLMSRFGWTAQYETEFDIGFSTFEMQLDLSNLPLCGALLDTQARLAHIGRSSVHIVHRILNPATGQTIATLHQLGVHLNKAARRPSPIADHIKESASASMTVG